MTYIDHRMGPGVPEHASDEVIHSWRRFTDNRLREIYGHHAVAERAAMTAADVRAWSALGTKGRAAA